MKNMETIALKGNGQVRQGRTEIDVPYNDGKITFVQPLVGPNYHAEVMGSIDSQGLLRPTTAQTLSLVDLAMQNPDEAHCKEILERFRKNYLWTSTESLSFPEGVIVYDNVDGKMPSTSKELMKLADKNDPRARFVQRGFKTGEMRISEFLEHPYTVAQVGEDMLPVVQRVAEQLNKKYAYIYGLDEASQDTKRFTAVYVYVDRLLLCGDYRGGGRVGCASGVLNTGEASRAKSKRAKKK
jgi:hypothetical protein